MIREILSIIILVAIIVFVLFLLYAMYKNMREKGFGRGCSVVIAIGFIIFVVVINIARSCERNAIDSLLNTSRIEDGIHCAKVEYYNPNTGTFSVYTLEVEVENEEIVKIYWPNGGWLDDSHFTPVEISDGNASFTSDVGYEYEVTLLDGEDCSFGKHSLYNYDSEAEDEICPGCGGEKDSWEKLCEDCQDKICPMCGGSKFPYDDYCDDCQEEIDASENQDDW